MRYLHLISPPFSPSYLHQVTINLTRDITKGFMAAATQTVADLLEQSYNQLTRLTLRATVADGATPLGGMCLKVVGANEYLDGGAVLDYTYIRRCLKKQQEVRLSLVTLPARAAPRTAAAAGTATAAAATAATATAAATAGASSSSMPPPPPPPPPWLSSSPDGRTLSLWDLSPHSKLRVRLLSLESLHGSVARRLRATKGGSCQWTVHVRLGIYNGGTLLAPLVTSGPLPCDETSNPQWNAWLCTTLAMVHMPRAARACLTLYGRPSLGAGKKELDEVPLGWASLQLFGHQELLASGVHSLRLWPDEVANPIGSHMANLSVDPTGHGLEPPVLFVQLDAYVRPVRLPRPDDGEGGEGGGGGEVRDAIAITSPSSGRTKVLGPSPDPEEIVQIKRVIEQDPLAVLSAADKQLLWRFRHFMVSSPAALPKLLQCHSWKDRFQARHYLLWLYGVLTTYHAATCHVPLLTTQVREMHAVLRAWAPLKPVAALELLDAKFADEAIRSHAVACLEAISDGELADLVLQLTQVMMRIYTMHAPCTCMHAPCTCLLWLYSPWPYLL